MYRRSALSRSKCQSPFRRRITQASVALSLALGGACPHCMGEDLHEMSLAASRLEGTAGIAAVTDPAAWSGGSLPISARVMVTEIKMDPPGTDGNHEFIELAGDPSSQLSGHWLIALEGDADANPGQIDLAIDLSRCATGPCQLDAQGLLVIAAEPGAMTLPEGSAWHAAKELVNGKLENGTTTLMVVDGLVSSELGSDWDVDDNGVLEVPQLVTVRHAVAWSDGGSGDRAYSTEIVGPKPKAQAAWSCVAPNLAATWRWGELQGDAASLVMNSARAVPEGLEPVTLTPGHLNDCRAPVSVVSAGGTEASVGEAGNSSLDDSSINNAGAGGTENQRLATCPTVDPEAFAALAGAAGSVSTVSHAEVSGLVTGAGTMPRASSVSGGSASLPAAADCGGATGQPRVVALAIPQAGSSGWWSPNPFASPFGGAAHGTSSIKSGSGVEAKDSDPPQLPGSCALRKFSHRRAPNLFLLAATCGALVRVRRPRRAVR